MHVHTPPPPGLLPLPRGAGGVQPVPLRVLRRQARRGAVRFAISNARLAGFGCRCAVQICAARLASNRPLVIRTRPHPPRPGSCSWRPSPPTSASPCSASSTTPRRGTRRRRQTRWRARCIWTWARCWRRRRWVHVLRVCGGGGACCLSARCVLVGGCFYFTVVFLTASSSSSPPPPPGQGRRQAGCPGAGTRRAQVSRGAACNAARLPSTGIINVRSTCVNRTSTPPPPQPALQVRADGGPHPQGLERQPRALR
jgi:hypothetical protein